MICLSYFFLSKNIFYQVILLYYWEIHTEIYFATSDKIYVWQTCREKFTVLECNFDMIITLFFSTAPSKEMKVGKYWFTCSLDMIKQACVPNTGLSAFTFTWITCHIISTSRFEGSTVVTTSRQWTERFSECECWICEVSFITEP
jgi:hypothetical protein